MGMTNIAPITKGALNDILNALSESNEYGAVLRAKGMIKAADADTWYHFDLTPGQYEIREGAPDYTGKACVIGSDLKEEDIKKLF